MNVHERVRTNMKEFQAAVEKATGRHVELPPKSSSEFKGEFTALELGQSLAARFPYQARFANPVGYLQGGVLSALFDEVFGPLSYMAAGKPTLTIEMSTTYLSPFSAEEAFVDISAQVIKKGRNLLVMHAEARGKSGKLIATSSTHCLVMA